MFHTKWFGESSMKLSMKLTTHLKAFRPNVIQVFANTESLKEATSITISETYTGNGLGRELHRMLNSGSLLTHHHRMTIALATDPESIMRCLVLGRN